MDEKKVTAESKAKTQFYFQILPKNKSFATKNTLVIINPKDFFDTKKTLFVGKSSSALDVGKNLKCVTDGYYEFPGTAANLMEMLNGMGNFTEKFMFDPEL